MMRLARLHVARLTALVLCFASRWAMAATVTVTGSGPIPTVTVACRNAPGDAALIQRQLNACAAGKCAVQPVGTCVMDTQVTVPSGTVIVGGPGVTLDATTLPSGDMFIADSFNGRTQMTTLASGVTSGSTTLSVVSTAGLAIGSPIILETPSDVHWVASYILQNVSGTTLTTDRPIRKPFPSGSKLSTPFGGSFPSSIYILGNGMKWILGSGVSRGSEMMPCWHCGISDVGITSSSASKTGSFDFASFDAHWTRVTVNVVANSPTGLALEEAEASSIDNCTILGAATNAGMELNSCEGCTITSPTITGSHLMGISLSGGAPADTRSCVGTTITGGSITGATSSGVKVADGSSDTDIAGLNVVTTGTTTVGLLAGVTATAQPPARLRVHGGSYLGGATGSGLRLDGCYGCRVDGGTNANGNAVPLRVTGTYPTVALAVDGLLADNALDTGVAIAGTVASAWQATHAYSIGNMVTNAGGLYVCTVAGTSAGSGGPSGPTTGQPDGGATWDFVCRGSNSTCGTTIAKLSARNAANGGLACNADVTVSGGDLTDSGASVTNKYAVYVYGNTPTVTLRELEYGITTDTSKIWTGIRSDVAADVRVTGGHCNVPSAGSLVICLYNNAGATYRVSDHKIVGGGGATYYYWQTASGSKLLRGAGVDGSAAGTPFNIAAGTTSYGSITASGTAGVDYSWPLVTAASRVLVTQTSAGTVPCTSPPTVTLTAGSKITLTGSTTSCNSIYAIAIDGF